MFFMGRNELICASLISIGRLIVTKRQDREDDDDEYEDITNLYKKKDGKNF